MKSIVFILTLLLGVWSVAHADTITVPAGGDLQAAINVAKFGDTIVLQAGSVYETPAEFVSYTLPNKTGQGVITIVSSIAPPPDGTRVTLADRAKMPKLVVKRGSSFFEALHGARGYRLSGLWVTNKAGGTTSQLLSIRGTDIAHPDPRDPLVDWPRDIVIDHCFFNPVEWDLYPEKNLCSSVQTAVGLVGINVTVRDSMMKGFGAKYGSGAGADLPQCGNVVQDGESVAIGTAPGPMLLDNNQMETWFVAWFIGGGDPGSMYGGAVLADPAPTLTSATLTNVNGLKVGDNIAFEMNVGSTTWPGNTVGDGTITAINGNSVTFTHLIGKYGPTPNSVPIPDGVRPKTVADDGGVAPCSKNFLGAPSWCSRAYWGGYNPSNITITRNYVNKPQRWYDFAGSDGKGFFEVKLCDTCLIDGNIFEGNTGFTITVRNQGGRAPWSAIRNFMMSNNLATRFSAGFYTLFKDNEYLSTESSNIVFDNNLMYGEFDNSISVGFRPRVFSGTYGDNVRITHNTILQSGRIMNYGNSPDMAGIDELTNFVFRDNIVGWGSGSQVGYACFDGALTVCSPGYVWTKNAMIGAPSGPLPPGEQSLASFPAGNFNPSSVAAVGFVDPANGNYRLATSSPLKNAGSDGKDPGVDMDQLLAHLKGPIPVATPTPTSSPSPVSSPVASPTPVASPSPIATPLPSPAPTATPKPPAGAIQLSGVIFSALDGSRFNFTKVVLTDSSGVRKEFFTQDGSYVFNVAPGSYQIDVEQADYNSSPGKIVVNNVDSSTAGLSIMNFTIGPNTWFKEGAVTCVPSGSCDATPTPTPTPAPSPSPSPSPSPTPACVMSISAPTLAPGGSGILKVTLTSPINRTFTVTAIAAGGQVTVNPPTSQSFSNVTSTIVVQFKIQAKKKEGWISVSGPCGSESVLVGVN